MRKHWHIASGDFSCIHYLQFDEEHSLTVFYNPGDNKARSYTAIRPKMSDTLDMEHDSNLGYAEAHHCI